MHDPWGCYDVTCRDKPSPGHSESCHNRGQLWARKPAPRWWALQQLVLWASPPRMYVAPTLKSGALLFFWAWMPMMNILETHSSVPSALASNQQTGKSLGAWKLHYFLIDSKIHGHVFKSAIPTAGVGFSQEVKNLPAYLEKGKVLRSIIDRAVLVTTWKTSIRSRSFWKSAAYFYCWNQKSIFHKISSQKQVITAPLPAGMNAENLQPFTCTVLKHFITMSWKKRELQPMDNAQVKHFSNLLPSDIHRQKSQWVHSMI